MSCSRPIVDAKWLDKGRQVGTSGKTVKPKVYLALGISGSFQHLGGIKGNPFLLAINKRAAGMLEPLIDFIRYTPIPAFIPLFILWFGIGETEKIVVIFSAVFFQLVLMVANSVSTVPQALIDFAKTLGASRKEIVLKVIFRHAQPRIFKDLRVSMGWAWAGLMLAEIVGATSGIGFVIIQSQRLLQTGNVIAAIITVGVLGVITDVLFRNAYAKLFPWSSEEP